MLKTARCKEFTTPEGRKQAYDNMVAAGIDALVVIGGDGSIAGAQDLANEYNVPIVALPGTIDNDLSGTDATIGYDTALNTIMEAVDRLRDTATSHERLFFVEVMGHTAGYLALNGAIASGAEAAIIPEMETEVDQLAELINNGFRKSKNSAIVLVAENPQTGVEKTVVMNVVEAFMESVKGSMIAGNEVFLRGFGSFIISIGPRRRRGISRRTRRLRFPRTTFQLSSPPRRFWRR